MMTNELAPLRAVQDKIRDKIRSEFASLIPDEMWSGMVQSVVRDFTSDTTDRYPQREAPIKQMIRRAIEDECKTKIEEELFKHRAEFDGFANRKISEATEAIVRDHMPAMLAAAQASTVRMMVDMAIQNMRNSMGQL